MSENWNPLEAVALMRAARRGRSGPKLTRTEQYNAFAMLKSGVEQSVVSRMFGISQSSVSHLANCLNRTAGHLWRYSDVFNEWNRLGEEGFLAAYVTEENYLKAQRLKYRVATPSIDDQAALHLISNPRADSCSYGLIGAFQVANWRARIDWAECDKEVPEEGRGPIGWRYATVDDDDHPLVYHSIAPYDEPVRPDGLWMPWRTSGDAFDHTYQLMNIRSPRRGRPRK